MTLRAARVSEPTAAVVFVFLLALPVLVGLVLRLLRLEISVRALREISVRDPLTGLYNRRAGEERLTGDLARVNRGGVGSLAVALLDADGLKGINDSLGHAAGDAYLKDIASVVRGSLREGDWAARFSGDEFVVALWHPADLEAARKVLERIADGLRERPLPEGGYEKGCSKRHFPTFSAGLVLCRGGETAKGVLARADALLYAAKRLGRARTVQEPTIGTRTESSVESVAGRITS